MAFLISQSLGRLIRKQIGMQKQLLSLFSVFLLKKARFFQIRDDSLKNF